MKRTRRFAAIVALAIMGAAPTALSAFPAAPVVKIDSGRLRGASEDGVASWKGVPFAAAPTGSLRWRAPQPVARWSGVRDARAFGSDCMQEIFVGDAAALAGKPSEDCLFANIWKPAAASSGLPVVVWIYGGGFVNGGSSPAIYSGANLARKNVIFVSFNYRLGRFGSFAHPQLTREGADGGLIGNYGHLDQIAALKWVQRNIAAFGGDPANVTLVGESAGGMSVHSLVTSPMARGLFAKAVVMSGADAQTMSRENLAGVEQIGLNFALTKGIAPDDPQALAKLRALSAEQVTDGLNFLYLIDPPAGPATFSGPFVDGKIAVNALAAYGSGNFPNTPMLIGATDADIGGTAGFMVAGARHVAKSVAEHAPVWEYRFSYAASALGRSGAEHATDIPFFLNTEAARYANATTDRDKAMARTIGDYLLNFARSGNPNGTGVQDWPRLQKGSERLMNFSAEGKAEVIEDPWAAEINAAY